jgi:hypothetical protein
MLGNIIAGLGLRGMKTTIRGMSLCPAIFAFYTDRHRDLVDLESLLLRYKALEKPSMEIMKLGRKDDNEDEDDEEGMGGGEIGMVNGRSAGVRTGGSSRMAGQEDEDSDFDL